MARGPATFLRSTLSLAIVILSPGFGAFEAAAQTVSMPVRAPGAAAAPGMAVVGARSSHVGIPVQLPVVSLSLSFTLSPGLMAAPAVVMPGPVEVPSPAEGGLLSVEGLAASPQAVFVESERAVTAVVPARAAPGSDIQGATEAEQAAGSLGLLNDAAPAPADEKGAVELSGWELERLFDGKGRGLPAPGVSGAGVPLRSEREGGRAMPDPGQEAVPTESEPMLSLAPERAKPELAEPSKPAVAAPSAVHAAKPQGLSNGVVAVFGAALLLGVPAIMAAAGASLPFLAAVHPIATAFAAAVGGLYGLVTSLRKDGEAPSIGQVVAAVVRYGVLGGAGMYFILDLSQALFLGKLAAGISPLPAALATAALGQSAFQGKFADPETSSADRVMAVFPAVAAALGLGLGVKVPAQLLMTLAVNAMAATGVAAALFAALYRPGKSPAGGPASMARGYVLQALMSGLALSVASPYLWVPFMALAAWGLWDVLSATAREFLSRLRPSV